jgi:hypothetical protein
MKLIPRFPQLLSLPCAIVPLLVSTPLCSRADVGIGAKPLPGAEVIIDGTQATLKDKWTYWEGPRFGSSLPIKWKIVEDPVDSGKALQTDDPAVGI